MAWRKWLVRILVFGVVACCVGAGLLYHRFTDPAMVRQQVVEKLQAQFPGAIVTLDAARLRILGGITLTELRLVRRDDPDKIDLIYVPAADVYHDKEHLFNGQMALRKIELHRPRVRLLRDREGHWNLEGLFAAPESGGDPIPTLVIHQGTLVFEDRQAAANIKPLEITEVNLTILNDPLTTVVVDGAGTSETLGEVQIHGTWQRDTKEVELHVTAKGLPLVKRLVQRLAGYCPEGMLTGLEVEGCAEVKSQFHYQPNAPRPWNYDMRCQVHQGKLRHPQLPLPLDNLEVTMSCVNGTTTLEELKATSGGATVRAQGMAHLPRFDQDFRAMLTVDRLMLKPELFEKLPDSVKTLNAQFHPTGLVQVRCECECRAGQWLKHLWTLHPQQANVCFVGFPLPVSNMTGSMSYNCLTNLAEVDLQAGSKEQPLSLKGTWKDCDKAAAVNLALEARNIPLDEHLWEPMHVWPELQKLARSFHLTGKGDLKASIQHAPGAVEFYNTFHAHVYDATVNWEALPYPLQQASGWLDLYPNYWICHDCQGSHDGGLMRAKAWSVPLKAEDAPTAPQRIIVEVTGEHVGLGPDLKKALAASVPGVAKIWEMLSPVGRLNFGARIDQAPGQQQDLDVALDVRGCSLTPQAFPLALQDVCAYVRFHNNQVVIKNLTARHQRTRFSLGEGIVDLGRQGSYRMELTKLIGNPIVPDADLQNALPKNMREAWDSLKLVEPFAVETKVVVAQTPETNMLPVLWWDGKLWLHQATVNLGMEVKNVTGCIGCQGLHDGYQLKGLNGNLLLEKASVFNQPFHDVHAHFRVLEDRPDVMVLGLRAPLFGGDVTGEGRVEFGSRRLDYELNMTASQIQLPELSHHNFGPDHQLSGLVAARLYLKGKSDGLQSLEGNGSVDVPYSTTTKLLNLPLLLDLLKFLGLRLPDSTAFEEAHATFNILGKRFTLNRLDLLGSAISLSGQGTVNLDGTDVHLDFFPSWARMEQMLLLPSMLRTMPSEISKGLLKIEMRGQVGANPEDLKFRQVLVPVLTEPLQNMCDSVFGKGPERK